MVWYGMHHSWWILPVQSKELPQEAPSEGSVHLPTPVSHITWIVSISPYLIRTTAFHKPCAPPTSNAAIGNMIKSCHLSPCAATACHWLFWGTCDQLSPVLPGPGELELRGPGQGWLPTAHILCRYISNCKLAGILVSRVKIINQLGKSVEWLEINRISFDADIMY